MLTLTENASTLIKNLADPGGRGGRRRAADQRGCGEHQSHGRPDPGSGAD